MRPTTHTEHIVTSAIDMRDDVLRDEVPGIVGDACHGILGERDAIVQAIEQEDTRPIRRVATGTTPLSMPEASPDGDTAASLDAIVRVAAARRDVAAIRNAFDAVDTSTTSTREDSELSEVAELHDDAFTMTLARGSSPSLDGAIAFARGSSTSLDREAAIARSVSAPQIGPVPISMARTSSIDARESTARMTMSRDGGRSR
jgi:hypothetical protein